jgi:hypothetical protein
MIIRHSTSAIGEHRAQVNSRLSSIRRPQNLVFLLGFVFTALSGGSIEARDARPIVYETMRTRGLGGCAVALCDDEQALFMNPAGLGQITDKEYALVALQGEANRDYRRVTNKTDGLSDQDTPEARAANNDALSAVMGQHARLAASNLSYYLGGTGFGAAFLYQAVSAVAVQRPTNPRIHATGDIDSVLTGAIARQIPGPRVLFRDQSHGWWGVGLKFLSRRSLDHEFDARDFAGLSEKDLRDRAFKGATFDLDGGILWRLANPWYPSLGLAINNVLGTEVDPLIGRLPRQIAVGAAIRPLGGPPERNRKLVLAADLHDVDGRGTLFTRLRVGAEVEMHRYIKIRGGFRGGYPTAGFTADFGDARFEAAVWSEELGDRPGDREDRRYGAHASFAF